MISLSKLYTSMFSIIIIMTENSIIVILLLYYYTRYFYIINSILYSIHIVFYIVFLYSIINGILLPKRNSKTKFFKL